MIKLRCDKCGKRYTVPDDYAGRKVMCSRCRSVMRVGEDISDWLAAVKEVTQMFGHYEPAGDEGEPEQALPESPDDSADEPAGKRRP